MFFKNCSSTNGKCLAPQLCWSKALSLHCYQDNYSWYYLLELGLPRTKTGAFSQELLQCVGAQSLQDANPYREMGPWAVEAFYSSWNPAALIPKMLSITFSAGRQTLLTSLLAKHQLSSKKSRGKLHWGLIQTPKPSRNSKPATWAFGRWHLVPSSGSRGHAGGWARDRSPHCPTPAQGGAGALTGGFIPVTTLNSHRPLFPFTWLNLFKPIYVSVKESSPI